MTPLSHNLQMIYNQPVSVMGKDAEKERKYE